MGRVSAKMKPIGLGHPGFRMSIPGLTIDFESGRPVYRQIAEAIERAVRAGRLVPGTRLPATRDLARRLGVHRNTVVAAYELLVSEGVVHSHTGRGTFVRAAPPAGDSPVGDAWSPGLARALEAPHLGRLLSAYRLAVSEEGISFASSAPAADLLPVEAFRQALDQTLASEGSRVLGYGPLAGSPGLREAIAERMRRRGSPMTVEQIVITNGSQQALQLVFRALVDPGSPVVVEDPTFTGALSALGALDARPVGVPLDEEGLRLDLLERALERHRPRVVYVQPTFHNPTTRVMGLERRRELLRLVARYGALVVEDDWADALRLEGEDLPTLHALEGGERVIYVGSFSKKLMPGLRVGWVAAPPRLVEHLVALKQVEDCGTSPLLQGALHRFLVAGGLEQHLVRALAAYRERRDRMLEMMARHFPGTASWTRPAGGLFVWVTLAPGLDSNELFLAAREKGVLFSRGELFHVNGRGREHLRLAFGAVTPEQIEPGIRILGDLLRRRRPRGPREVARRDAEAVPIL